MLVLLDDTTPEGLPVHNPGTLSADLATHRRNELAWHAPRRRVSSLRLWREDSSTIVRLGHAVADPTLAEDVGGTAHIVAQLAAELLYEGARRPGGTPAPRAPHTVQRVVVARLRHLRARFG